MKWQIPYLTADLPGIGGEIRREIEDFVVEEVPAYEPGGEGEHTFFRVEKRGISTPALIQSVARELGCPEREIGNAGLKDARSIARQTLSVRGVSPEAVTAIMLDRAEILWAKRHTNKLRPGHLRGNRFTLRIRDVVPDAARRAEPILATLSVRGVPNGYGVQRFGAYGDTHHIGRMALKGDREGLKARGIRRPSKRMQRFYASALQSALFNRYLTERMERELMDDLLLGDVARKETTGGIFVVEDVEVERPRVKAWEISPTGPMYGYKMLQAQAYAGALEAEILNEAEIELEEFRVVRSKGTRRPLRYQPEGLRWEMEDEGTFVVSFFAPKGSYATMLLRELMKAEAVLDEEEDGDEE